MKTYIIIVILLFALCFTGCGKKEMLAKLDAMQDVIDSADETIKALNEALGLAKDGLAALQLQLLSKNMAENSTMKDMSGEIGELNKKIAEQGKIIKKLQAELDVERAKYLPPGQVK